MLRVCLIHASLFQFNLDGVKVSNREERRSRSGNPDEYKDFVL